MKTILRCAFRLLPGLFIIANGVPGASAADAAAAVSYRLAIRLEPAARTLAGEATIRIHDGDAAELALDARFEADPVRLDGVALDARATSDGRWRLWRLPAGASGRTVVVRWRGTLATPATGVEHRDTLTSRAAVADPNGSFLPGASLWYPVVFRDGAPVLHAYRLSLDLPEGQRGLVAGSRRSESVHEGRAVAEFDFPHPGEGIDLVAGPYVVDERTTRSVDGRPIALRTYFHPSIVALASGYLDSVRDYLALYEAWIGPYPFDSFAVVSSPTPTGFGMPGFTYLGIEVLKLPFIRSTSLGHEVLHNWWGNGVYPDYARGNWSEGLTTFMADYTYAQRESADKARAMRLGWLRDLSGIPPGADRPLAEFTARRHGISQAVGYAKAAMLFAMLRERLGETAFDRGIQRFWQTQRFRVAGWDALRAAFEAESGKPLGRFFEQWLERAGLPAPALTDARRTRDGLALTLEQGTPPYELDVPLRIDTADGTVIRQVRFDQARQRFELELAGEATRVTLDPDSRLLRRLGPHEAPPILRELQVERRTRLLALGDESIADAARALAARMLDHPPAPQAADAVPGGEPLLVVGEAARIDAWLARHGLPEAPAEVAAVRGTVRVWTLRLPSGAALALVAASDPAALAAAARPLPHYRQQSWLVFDGGRALARGVWPAEAMSIPVATD